MMQKGKSAQIRELKHYALLQAQEITTLRTILWCVVDALENRETVVPMEKYGAALKNGPYLSSQMTPDGMILKAFDPPTKTGLVDAQGIEILSPTEKQPDGTDND